MPAGNSHQTQPVRKRFPKPPLDQWDIKGEKKSEEGVRPCPIYARLVELAADGSDKENQKLIRLANEIVDQASTLAGQGNNDFTQYTDHGPTHFKNVLWWMGLLAGESIQHWTALECAIAICAAFAHDLGMIVRSPEREALMSEQERQTAGLGSVDDHADQIEYALLWQNYRAGDHQAWLKFLEGGQKEQKWYNDARTNYLRQTHADTTFTGEISRIEKNLKFLLKIYNKEDEMRWFGYEGQSLLPGLIYVCESHVQEIGYVRRKLTAANSPYQWMRRGDLEKLTYWPGPQKQPVHWERLEWLLRLADIMDLDKTRTPQVRFWDVTDPYSRQEWKKHMSIHEILEEPISGETGAWRLVYEVNTCESVSVEKALYKMAYCDSNSPSAPPTGWINDELRKVRHASQNYLKENLFHGQVLDIPNEAHVMVLSRSDYEWRDVAFHLDQQSIRGLLMGQALYEKPSDALRELVQNALDAVHLKDQRGKLDGKNERDLHVNVRWGTGKRVWSENDKDGRSLRKEEDKQYIEVEDNGVGMSSDTLISYLSKVGQSFYNSSEYLRERYRLRSNGLVPTPISQFGIGFLAVFMLADEIEIYTRSIKDAEGLQTVVRVYGKDAVWSLNTEPIPVADEKRKATFTRVKLWLKPQLYFTETFNKNEFLNAMRHHFYGSNEQIIGDPGEDPKENEIDPARTLAKCIVWPLYPIKLYPPAGPGKPPVEEAEIAIDDQFHLRELLNVQVDSVRRMDGLSQVGLFSIDWTDDFSRMHPSNSNPNDLEIPTGSRIRLTHFVDKSEKYENADSDKLDWPDFEQERSSQTREEIITRSAPSIPIKGRFLILCNGILLPVWDDLLTYALVNPGVGSLLWLDFRGAATPRLKADRSKISTLQDHYPGSSVSRKDAATAMQERWVDSLAQIDRVWKRTTVSLRSEKVRWKSQPAQKWSPPFYERSADLSIWVQNIVRSWLQEQVSNRQILQSIEYTSGADRQLQTYVKPVRRDDQIGASAVGKFKYEIYRNTGAVAPPDDRGGILAEFLITEKDKDCNLSHNDASPYLFSRNAADWSAFHNDLNDSHEIRKKLTARLNKRNQQFIQAWEFFVNSHHFSASFFPELKKSLPALCAYNMEGTLHPNTHRLLGPLILESKETRLGSSLLLEENEIDFVAPLTALPVGSLGSRELTSPWHARFHRHVLLLPFYLGKVPSCLNPSAITAKFGQTRVSLYVPSASGLGDDWNALEKRVSANSDERGVTMLWNIASGELKWLDGFRNKATIEKEGSNWPTD